MGLILCGNINVDNIDIVHFPPSNTELPSEQNRKITTNWKTMGFQPRTLRSQVSALPLELQSQPQLTTHQHSQGCLVFKTYLTKFLPAWFCHPQSQRWTDLERCSEAESFCRQLGTPLVRGRRRHRHRHRRRIGWLAPDLRCPWGPKFFGMCPFPVHFDGVGLVL